ncbi:hypothetical protein ACL02R_26070 [Streptomyces sp. MS19]|uniref:hypothetical protein n=1 Tax=Streptomyces sp. MS19 TaxID=3385972 RepID=UPI0039A1BF3D
MASASRAAAPAVRTSARTARTAAWAASTSSRSRASRTCTLPITAAASARVPDHASPSSRRASTGPTAPAIPRYAARART